MSTIDEVKARIDIIELVSETVKLRRSGKNYSGLCPFHSEKTPSFIVSPERGTWRCFGQCNEGGDIFSFVMKREGWDFKEALRFLAGKAGVVLESFTPRQLEAKDAHERLRQLLEEAATFYRQQLLNTPAGQPALAYLREKRGLDNSAIEAFGLGYAPNSWDAASKHFSAQGFNDSDLVQAGLVTVRENEQGLEASQTRKTHDRFRNRIMFPIRDERSRMTGFGARILDPDDVPKFLNSPETVLFSKSHLLYGLDRARKAIRATDQAVIVEGYLDVIALHQAGFENVVAPMGTALSEDQLRLLKRFTPGNRIVLALDPDAAGRAAVLRGLDAARQALTREHETTFDVHGLLRHEARLHADLRVASLPEGFDPDELIRHDPKAWKDLIEQAQPIVLYVMNMLAVGRDLDDARVKSEITAQVLPLIEDLPDPVERDSYRQRLARFIKVDERAIMDTRVRVGHARAARRPSTTEATGQESAIPPEASPVSPAQKVEANALGILLAKPDLMYHLNRALGQASLGHLAVEDFGYTDHRILFELVHEALEQEEMSPCEFISRSMPASLVEMANDLSAQFTRDDIREEKFVQELLRAVVKIRRLGLSESINQLRFLQEEAQQQGDMRITSYREMVQQHTLLLRNLDQAGRKISERR